MYCFLFFIVLFSVFCFILFYFILLHVGVHLFLCLWWSSSFSSYPSSSSCFFFFFWLGLSFVTIIKNTGIVSVLSVQDFFFVCNNCLCLHKSVVICLLSVFLFICLFVSVFILKVSVGLLSVDSATSRR